MTDMTKTIFVAALMVTVSACAQTTPVVNAPAPSAQNADALVSGSIDSSSERIASALETLAMVERAKTAPKPLPVNEDLLPPELRRETSLEWTGRADLLLRDLSRSIGYEFVVIGENPSSPMMVNVDGVDQPIARYLDSIHLQLYPVASIVVDPTLARIELRYDLGASL